MNDPQLVGHLLRAVIALGVVLLAAGGAARLCRGRASWSIAGGVFLLGFLWLLLGVSPHPHRNGLLYSLQWGVAGAALYAAGRALRAPSGPPADPETLLGFWFGDDLSSPETVEKRTALWFGRDDAFDGAIRERFARWPDRAAGGDWNDWATTPRGALALVIALDQLPRNLHRDRARAYAYDERARSVALAALERGADDALHPIEAAFLYLPLEHAEDPALQARCVALFSRLAERCTPELADTIARYRAHAEQHRDVIERFGRFPHRNRALGRDSTEEESGWLADEGARSGA